MAHTRAEPSTRGSPLSPDAAAATSCTGSPGRSAAVGYAPGARTAPTTAWPAGTAPPSVTISRERSVPAGIGPRATWPTTAARSPAGRVGTPGPTSTSVVVTMSSPTVWPAATSWLVTSTATRVEVARDHAAKARPEPNTSSSPSAIHGMRRFVEGARARARACVIRRVLSRTPSGAPRSVGERGAPHRKRGSKGGPPTATLREGRYGGPHRLPPRRPPFGRHGGFSGDLNHPA